MKRFLFLLKTIVSRKRLLPTIVVLAGMLFLARLGIWQLDRLEQRRALNAELRMALESPPIEISDENLLVQPDTLKDREVVVQGEYDFDRQVILKLQNWGGKTGVHLITPLLIAGSDTAVLVDRGWVPEPDSDIKDWSDFDTPGLVSVRGYIAHSQALPQAQTNTSQPDAPQKEWYRVNIETLQPQMPYPLLPIYIAQAPLPSGNIVPPFRREREVDLSEGPHLGYAIQWFIFTLLLGTIYLVYVNKSTPPLKDDL